MPATRLLASRIVFGLVLLITGLAAVMFWRAAQLKTAQQAAPGPSPFSPPDGAVDRLSEGIRFKTISTPDPKGRNEEEFRKYHDFLRTAYARLHQSATRETIGKDGLLFTWPGTDASRAPILLTAHMDVVPIEAGTENLWTNPPFSGRVDGGFVWGRGALDDKTGVHGLLEAAEMLLAANFLPARTVYIAFGADEEVGGKLAAVKIAEALRSRGIHPELVLDEGGSVTDGIIPSTTRPIAMVGIAEKGYLSVELLARSSGGHSSMPPAHTAAGLVARAVSRLEENPFPPRIGGVAALNLRFLAAEMPFLPRFAIANQWLLGSLVRRQLAATPRTDSMMRTTTAVTMLEGSPKDNILPTRARAVVNFRILPGDTVESVLKRVREVIADPLVEVSPLPGLADDPSAISSTSSVAWRSLNTTIRQVYPEAAVVPYLTGGATDVRHYNDLSTNVYRFLPVLMQPADLTRMHGLNERISTNTFNRAIQFYRQLLLNLAQ